MEISLSEIDKKRFGIATAKVFLESNDDVVKVVEWCKLNKAVFIITRCSTRDIKLVQSLESEGFFLTDTLVYYENKKFSKIEHSVSDGYTWRLASAEDAGEVESLAAEIFKGYFGHYHADTRINKEDADLVYSSWAHSSCMGGADVVLLICHNERIVGFLTLRTTNSESCEIVLNGVNPLYQNKGLYHTLVTLAKNWASVNNMKSIIVSTQVTNIAAQKIWCRQGFEPLNSYYTFHKWLDR